MFCYVCGCMKTMDEDLVVTSPLMVNIGWDKLCDMEHEIIRQACGVLDRTI